MNYNNKIRQRVAGVIRYSCALLFVLFSFCFLIFLDGDLLAMAQHVYSSGVTHYSIFIGAVIITLSLQLLQWVLSKVVRFPDLFYALSYFPSFLALVMVTHMDQQSLETADFSMWKWLAPLLLCLYAVIVITVKRLDSRSSVRFREFSALLWPNYLLLMLMMLFAGSMHSAADVYMYELKTERLILQGDYADACRVGQKATVTSRRLNNLRAYALSKQGLLADGLFLYPQPYGADGLLCLSDTDSLCYRFDARDICFSLGGQCGRSVVSLDHFLRLLMNRQQEVADSIANVDSLLLSTYSDSLLDVRQRRIDQLEVYRERTRQYYLCKLLLDKNLDAFCLQLEQTYRLDTLDEQLPDTLPRSYREALALACPERSDSLTLRQLDDYRSMKDSLTNMKIRKNLTRRHFGNTYWWYYDYE